MKKVGVSFGQNKVWEIGMTESKLVFKRKLLGEDEQLIMFRQLLMLFLVTLCNILMFAFSKDNYPFLIMPYIDRMTNGNGNNFGSGDKYNEVEFKAEHPQTPLMNVNYKVHIFIAVFPLHSIQ